MNDSRLIGLFSEECQNEEIKDENYEHILNFEIRDLAPKQLKEMINNVGINYPFAFYIKSIPTYSHERNILICFSQNDNVDITAHLNIPTEYKTGALYMRENITDDEITIDDIFKRKWYFSRTAKIKNIELDFMSMYEIYENMGCDYELYKGKIIDHIRFRFDEAEDYKQKLDKMDYQENSLENIKNIYIEYYELNFLFLWFLTNCVILQLKDSSFNFKTSLGNEVISQNAIQLSFDRVGKDFFNSEAYRKIKDNLFDEINEYYQLLTNYFYNMQ